MLAEVIESLKIVLFLVILFFLPGYLLQRLLIRSEDVLTALVFSLAFSMAFIVVVCPVLDIIWEISLFSIILSTILFSVILFFVIHLFKIQQHLKLPERWEIIILFLILLYGILLRSYTLTDTLPEGQDAWRHLSFTFYVFENHALPQFVPWAEPPQPVTLVLYPPGAHCIGALFSSVTSGISFFHLKFLFIAVGTSSVLSSYVVFRDFFGKKIALLSALLVVVFIPHMFVTTEIIAEALAIFMAPLIPYVFIKKKVPASALLLSGVMLTHHISAFAVFMSLATLALAFCVRFKNMKYFLALICVSGISLVLSFSWWSQVSFGETYNQLGSGTLPEIYQEGVFRPYVEMVSPLFIFVSMIGFFIFLRERTDSSLFVIAWATVLFLASQPAVPISFHNHRFLAFFVFPCSVMASVGLQKVRTYVGNFFLVFLLLLLSLVISPHFWPTTGEENREASEWIEDSTLDSVFYVYGSHYTFIYPLSHRKIHEIHEIEDFDNPFLYKATSAYFYDDVAWLPHDMTRFGKFDQIYSCKGVVILRIE